MVTPLVSLCYFKLIFCLVTITWLETRLLTVFMHTRVFREFGECRKKEIRNKYKKNQGLCVIISLLPLPMNDWTFYACLCIMLITKINNNGIQIFKQNLILNDKYNFNIWNNFWLSDLSHKKIISSLKNYWWLKIWRIVGISLAKTAKIFKRILQMSMSKFVLIFFHSETFFYFDTFQPFVSVYVSLTLTRTYMLVVK